MIKKYTNISLKPLNTFGIEASCDSMIDFESIEDLREIFAEGHMEGQRWNVLGGGSNIVLTDNYHGTLLHPVSRKITVISDDGNTVCVKADAGVIWNDFVVWSVEQGLWGAENLSYIPGMVGAAPVQNIGAYGVEVKDIIDSVELYDVKTDTKLTLVAGHCAFGYRDSVFKHDLKGRVVITSVNFALSKIADPKLDYGDIRKETDSMSGGATLENICNAVTNIRRSKLPEPEEIGNAGSFFKNPVINAEVAERMKREYPDMPLYPAPQEGSVKLAAGWLIDRCGWKGRSLGRAGVDAKQALVLVNLGGVTGGEVMELARQIQKDVRDKFGVIIEIEVNIW